MAGQKSATGSNKSFPKDPVQLTSGGSGACKAQLSVRSMSCTCMLCKGTAQHSSQSSTGLELQGTLAAFPQAPLTHTSQTCTGERGRGRGKGVVLAGSSKLAGVRVTKSPGPHW